MARLFKLNILRQVVLFLGFIFCSSVVYAQTTLRIAVQDKNNGEPGAFAYINIYTETGAIENTVQTDEQGVATISPKKYPCSIEIKLLGYETYKRRFNSTPRNNNITISLIKNFSSLNEAVVTGIVRPKKQKDALSVYRVITKEQIDAQGAITLNEVMKNQLNIRVDNDNILGSGMRMQGLSSNKVKILIDGLPINGREGGNINLSQINMNNVERIELVQGPMSVVYGTDALGGVVNIITKKQKQNLAVSAGGYYESIGRYNFDASITKRIKKRHQLTLGGGQNYFQGWKTLTEFKEYHGDTIFSSRSFLFKPQQQYLGNLAYSYTAPSGFNAQLASDFLNEKITNKGNLNKWDPFNGAEAKDEYYRTTRSMNRLSLAGKLGEKGRWQSQNGYMLYHRTRTSYVKNMVTLAEALNQEKGAQDTSSFNDVYARGSYNNSIGKLEYTVGYDVNLQFATSLKINGKKKEIQDYALYTNLSYQLIEDKLKVNAGFRGAINTVYDPPIIPTVNLLYKPKKNLQIRASYAKGYRAPSLKELYLNFIDVNHFVIGNENLSAESSEHIQLSASLQAYEHKDNYLQFIVTGFYNDVYNGITLAPINPEDTNSIEYTYANLAHQRNTIATFQTDGQFGNIHFQVGYSYNYTFEDEGNYDAFSASEATAQVQYSWIKTGLKFNAIYKFYGDQPFLQSNIDGSASFNGEQKAFSLCDLSVSKKFLNRKLKVMAGVKNLFDMQQPTVSGRVSSGAHGGGIASFLPRSVFTSLRLNID